MKKLILLILTLTLILGVFASCQKRYLTIDDETSSSPSEHTDSENITGDITESNETNQTENTETNDRLTEITEPIDPEANKYKYTVEKIDGNYYLVFNDYVKTSTYEPFGMVHYVPSIDYLKNTIPSGNMDTGYKKYVMSRISDNDPDHKVQIYDIEHIWQPTFPDNLPTVVNKNIEWNFTSYTFTTLYENRPGHNATVLLEEDYKEALERDREALVSYGYSKKELSDGEKELTVFYASGESVHDDGARLYSYTIYVTNGQYHGIINIGLERELTDTELLQFGFEEYLG